MYLFNDNLGTGEGRSRPAVCLIWLSAWQTINVIVRINDKGQDQGRKRKAEDGLYKE